MKITISGTAGSGKSTIAKMLAKKLGFRHYSMGDFQREIAKEKGVTIEELGELEKKDPSIDRMVDERQKKLGIEDNDFVIDAWLSHLFIPDSFKIFMDADIKERAKRIFSREPKNYASQEDAEKKISERESANIERWKRFYGHDFRDMANYDLVIDTTGKNIDEVFNLVLNRVIQKQK